MRDGGKERVREDEKGKERRKVWKREEEELSERIKFNVREGKGRGKLRVRKIKFFPPPAAHYDQDGPFHCHKCGVAFISRLALTQHCDKHRDKTSFFCGECWMYFTHPAVFNTHLMSHAGEREREEREKKECY